MAPRTLPGLGLSGFWSLGEDGWNTGADQNWLKMSVVAQLSAISRTTPLPGSPSDGDIYIVPADAPSEPNKVAVRDNGAWAYMTPQEGWRAWVRDTDEQVVFDGSAWGTFGGGGVADGSVTNAKLADMATARIKGRASAGTGSPEDLTGAQVTALLNTFTSGANGLAPASGGGTTNFLRADGTWAAPPGGGVGLPYDIRLGFVTTPTSNQIVDTLPVVRAFEIAANMAGSRGRVGTNPTASFDLTIRKNGTTVATMSISTSGVFTLTTVGGVVQSFAEGDVLTLQAQSTTDATIANLSFVLKGATV